MQRHIKLLFWNLMLGLEWLGLSSENSGSSIWDYRLERGGDWNQEAEGTEEGGWEPHVRQKHRVWRRRYRK